jgi:hypothetical protein
MPTLHGNLLPPSLSALKLEPARSSEKSIVPHSIRHQPWTLLVQENGFSDRLYEHGDELETDFLSIGRHLIHVLHTQITHYHCYKTRR